MKIHYLQHVPFENPGSILTWAKEKGFPVTDTKLYAKETFPKTKDFDWLIIMGGPMNIYEEEKYPWLITEKLFIQKAIEENKVVIGLCLGGQLIADILGGRVVKNPCTEIGWFPVTWTDRALSYSWFSHFPKEAVVFEWHGDTFTDLPEEVVLLAENEACKNQAFQYKNRVFGFQFHLENTLEIINNLIENCSDEMVPGKYVQTAEELVSRREYMEQDNQWMTRFLSKVAALYEADEL
jgi:GMP synthase-like glutamine amidotransferase